MHLATVAATSPLTVRTAPGADPISAKVVRGSSYSPTLSDTVLVVFINGRTYIVGGA